MPIIFHENTMTFHLCNSAFSCIFKILEPGYPVSLYFGKKVHDSENSDHLLQKESRAMSVVFDDAHDNLSLEHLKQEYPVYGTGDMRSPALDIRASNGSRLLDLRYVSHEIIPGIPEHKNLPGVYCEHEDEAETLFLKLHDEKSGLSVILRYTVAKNIPALIRSAKIINESEQEILLETAMSMNLDLPDTDYEMISLSGAWARERYVQRQPLHHGIQAVSSMRGHSSNNFNPFIALARPYTTETAGEAIGFSLVYSGNFLAEVYADTYHTARVRMGIHPDTFEWHLHAEESFETPESVIVYSDSGLNGMSEIYHELYRTRLARGYWRDRERPILVNNWEGTYFHFNEEKLLEIAQCAKELGIEMFVLDDGWFRNRNNDLTGLGDWIVDKEKFPYGLGHFVDAVHAEGLLCGLWIEPEMVNPGTDLFREHPEWIIHEEGRDMHPGRHQYTLDFSNPEVVDCIFNKLKAVLDEAHVDYIKWDMNRSMADVYSMTLKHQGELSHRYILGIYSLYEKLLEAYPKILFESCSSGGARFDPGMLYYAPQCWTSDDTDASERQKIQYGTSFVYPISSMGAHVSAVPNHQLHRTVSLKTRADTAYFGAFGYELDLTKLSEAEKEEVKKQVAFMKEHRRLLQYGTFLRLKSPFESNECIWMSVSPDQTEAVLAYYRRNAEVNVGYRRIRLAGLNPDALYTVNDEPHAYYGDELMNVGLMLKEPSYGDYISGLYLLKQK